jgi:hypothetical protein
MKKRAIIYLIGLSLVFSGTSAQADDQGISDAVRSALERAGDNRAELLKAQGLIPADQRESFAFLIANMAERDLTSLNADFLLTNISLAHLVMQQVPWGGDVPDAIFHNYVLPYANVSEKRDNWRKPFHRDFLPLIRDCPNISQAAETLNSTIFKKLKVKYSRQRRAADQGPFETMETGLASCTGLSILLIDACRAVGIPARLAGIPLWADRSGNHTWVEIWDKGWHFTGAAEPAKLNSTWFAGKASKAQKGHARHAIFAVSYKKTDRHFPMVWARTARYVNAVDNTDMYLPKVVVAAEKPQLAIKVLDLKGGTRLEAEVKLIDSAGKVLAEGRSKGPQADMNNHLNLPLPELEQFDIQITLGLRQIRRRLTRAQCQTQVLEFALAEARPATVPEFAGQRQGKKLKALLETWFTATDEQRAGIRFKDAHNRLLLQHESAIRQMIWNAYCQGLKATSLREDFDQNQVKNNSYLSPYFFKKVGNKPAQGWPLFIAMHGGGGAPQRVNDSQWNHMRIYYHDQMDGPGYLYLALRAPTNEWNGFYTEYVYPLIANLLRQFMIFDDINPNRVFLMGYSHGGYGAFAIGPIMADRFAAVHASAAAPTQGQTAPENLRNTHFTYMIGERDKAYKRVTFCQAFNETISRLRGERADIYPVTMEFKTGHGHGGLPDRDKIAQMISHTRNPLPRSIAWHLTVNNVPSFNWLHIPSPEKGQSVAATCQDDTITLQTENIRQIHVLLDQRLVDMNRPVTLCINGQRAVTAKLAPDLQTLCETLHDRGDPEFMFSTRMVLDLGMTDHDAHTDSGDVHADN